jgi:large subunit ribosomal protein L25
MADTTTRLTTSPRDIEGSRSNRRLRREGRVPCVLYGGGEDPQHFSVDARELRHALHGSGAVIELDVDGSTANAVVKDLQQHPVRGEAMHIDFVRVRMDVAIQAVVTLELTGVDEAPGIVEGGVLEQQTRELNIEALPGDIPESISHDASGLEINATLHLSEIAAPKGVTFLDDPETVIASITLPRLVLEAEDDVETETELVGEGEEGAEGEAAGEGEEGAEGGESEGDSDASSDE